MTNGFQLGSLIERVRTGSILAPLLALTLICATTAVSVTIIFRQLNELVWAAWAIFGVCVLFDLIAYVLLAIFEPDRLQTEDYRLARHRLDVIGDERDPNNRRLIEAAPAPNTFLEPGR